MAIFLNWFMPEEHFINYLVVFIWEQAPDVTKYVFSIFSL